MPGEIVIDEAGQGRRFHATELGDGAAGGAAITHLSVRRRHHRGLRPDHDARGQRPRLRLRSLAEDATESYFPEFKAATLEMIRAQGAIVGWTAPTDTIVAALHG